MIDGSDLPQEGTEGEGLKSVDVSREGAGNHTRGRAWSPNAGDDWQQ
jgi:hypothetical protein